MKSRFCLSLAVLAFLLSGCMSDGPDTIVLLFPSSSSEVPSSSSEVPSSSSEVPSSSSEAPSSSSEAPSSSSEAPSSSSEAPSSSSSVSNCADFDPEAEVEHYGQMKKQICDERDGKKYVYVVIGEQTWMAENLNYEVEGGKCNGEGDVVQNLPDAEIQANCMIYGRMYNWSTALGICPSSWHLPSEEEWDILTDYVGGSSTAGTKLKAESGWNNNGNGTDEYGFSALPGGNGGSSGSFIGVGRQGVWWTATELHADFGYNGRERVMLYNSTDVRTSGAMLKSDLLSVRCLQD